ncbi:MAG TPA: SMP-30/gluconolactonase/LRE family protein [Sphingobacteriaceae bacterium]
MIKVNDHKTLVNQSFYTEGPVIDSSGNFYFTTLTGGKIMKVDVSGEQSVWAEMSCPNGQTILENGDHLVCDSKQAVILRFNSHGNFIRKEIEGYCAESPINCTNDIISDSSGNIYFTDSVRHTGFVGFISNANQEKIISLNLDYPNGLALSNDESMLFVAESYKNRILAFDLTDFGKRHLVPEVFAALPEHITGEITRNLPDGIKVDLEGNIWVAHYGMGMVHILSPEGVLLQSVNTGFDLTSNLFIYENMAMVTGGYGEPGPGAFLEIEFKYED